MFAITIRERSGQVYTFHFDKPEVLIGRVKGNDVILPKQNISKRHTMVRVHGPQFVVEDLGSTNGTYVNGHRVTNAVEVGFEDKVYIGDFVMTFADLSQGTGATPPPLVSHDDAAGFPADDGHNSDDAGAGRRHNGGAGGRQRDNDTAGTMRARSVMMDVAPPVQSTASAHAGDVFEDQVELGDLESLLTTAQSDFAAEIDRRSSRAVAPADDLLAGMDSPAGSYDGAAGQDSAAGQESAGSDDAHPSGPPLGHQPTLRGVAAADNEFVDVGPMAAPADAATSYKRELRMTYAMDGLAEAIETRLALDDLDEAVAAPPVPVAASRALPTSLATPGPATPADSRGAQRLVPPPFVSAAYEPPPAPSMTSQALRILSAPGPAPTPLQVPERTPTTVDHPVATLTDQPHFDALSLMYRTAQRDLRPAVPTDAAQMSDTDWAEMEDRVVQFVDQAAAAGDIGADIDVARLKRDLIYELAGLGPLEPMLDDPSVEAVEVNGPNQIFVFRGAGREAVPERFSCQPALMAAVDRLVRATGIPLPRTASFADGTLVDGTSVRVVWPPLCPAGPAVLLRKPRPDAPDLAQLVERGVVAESAATILRHLVQRRRSIAVCGWPNVGRRTVVNSLGLLLDPGNRMLVIEDGQRLRLPQDHVVRLDSAAQTESGTQLLQLARRLMPDWLLMGECASVGVADLLTVAGDGLPPWIGSFFAKDERDMLTRAAHALMLRHPGLPESVALQRVAGVLDIVAVFGTDPQSGRAVLDGVFRVFDEPLEGSYVDRLTAQMFEE